MASEKSIWYQLGHAFERARHGAPKRRRVAGLAERARDTARDGVALAWRGVEEARSAPDHRSRSADRGIPAGDDLFAAGTALVFDRVLARLTGGRDRGIARLVRAGASGAAAAALIELVRPLLNDRAERPSLDRETADRILAGAGQGVLYGVLIEPHVPGPGVAKGAVYGLAEAAAGPAGGLGGLLGANAPQRRLPVVGRVFDGPESDDRAYLEHLVFGIALAVIYESSSSSSGMRSDES